MEILRIKVQMMMSQVLKTLMTPLLIKTKMTPLLIKTKLTSTMIRKMVKLKNLISTSMKMKIKTDWSIVYLFGINFGQKKKGMGVVN